MTPDFSYSIEDDLYHVYPNTEEAIKIWNNDPLLQSGMTKTEFLAFRRKARKNGHSVKILSEEDLIALVANEDESMVPFAALLADMMADEFDYTRDDQ